jgi:hypothetical protein
MAIDWAGVEAKLDEAATQARGESTIDAAIHVYNTKVIEALQLMINTAKVNGTGVVNGGAVPSGGGPFSAANVTEATIS